MSSKVNQSFLQRRWYEFRNGHGLYLIFAMAFVQFVILTYTLALERIDTLKQVFPSMWQWGFFFVVIYFPAAILVGHFHKKHQMRTEAMINTEANPYLYKTQPGKELLSLKVSRINYDLQIKSMIMQNEQADAFKKALGVDLPKWPDSAFLQVKANRDYTRRLEAGDDVRNLEVKEYDLDK